MRPGVFLCVPGSRYGAAEQELRPRQPSLPHLFHRRRGRPGRRSVRRQLVCSHRAIANADVTTLFYPKHTIYAPIPVIKSNRALLIFVHFAWKKRIQQLPDAV